MRNAPLLLVAACVAVVGFARTSRADDAPPAAAPSPPAEPSLAPPPTTPNARSGPDEGTSPPRDLERRAVAEALFFQGRGLMDAERFTEACPKFEDSYRLDPAAGTLINMAVCHTKIGKLASAWGEFKTCLAEAKRANRPDRELVASQYIAAIEPDLPYLTVNVGEAVRVAGLEIARNGVPLAESGWNTELPVDPGDVEIVVRAPAYKPRTLTIRVANKEHASVTVEPLERAPVVRAPTERVWTTKKRAGLVVGVAGVASAIAGGVFGGLALAQRAKSDDNCPFYLGERRCTQVGADEMGRAKTFATASDVLLGLGAIGLGVGGYLFFTGGTTERPLRSAQGASEPAVHVGFGFSRERFEGGLSGVF